MTSIIFNCINETESNELMESIWQTIRCWKVFGSKKMLLCRWHDSEGFHVGLSVENSVDASFSLNFKTSEKFEQYFKLVLNYGEDEKTIYIPANVVIKTYNGDVVDPEDIERQ